MQGGESEALKRLKHYLWDTDLVAKYFETRNGMLGVYSTRLAPWLAAGCLSPRTVFHEVKAYEQQRVANKSTYWVVLELTCRDWFRFYAAKQGPRIFLKGGPAGLSQLRWSSDPELWQRWSTGTTGMPLVDANMRELVQTGARVFVKGKAERGRRSMQSASPDVAENACCSLVLALTTDSVPGWWWLSLVLDTVPPANVRVCTRRCCMCCRRLDVQPWSPECC
jgi:hypothetical protein